MGVLRARALETPRRVAYTFLRDGEEEEAPLTYAALDEQARAIAAWLQDQGMAGERALLLHPPGVEFVAAFFGCLYAGVVAVPAYPPRLNRPDPRIQEIVADAQASLALTTEAVRSTLEPRRLQVPGLASLRWLATDVPPSGLAERWREPEETKLAEQPGPFLWVNAIRSAPFCWPAISQVRDPIQIHDWGAHNDVQGVRHCF